MINKNINIINLIIETYLVSFNLGVLTGVMIAILWDFDDTYLKIEKILKLIQ